MNKHLFIMNSLDSVKAWKDTSYFLMLACVEQGHQVYYADQQSLWLEQDQLMGNVTALAVHDSHDQPFTVLNQQYHAIAEMDVVWVRTDPPFDRRYFYTTLLLDYLPKSTRVVNRPSGIRNWNEKLAALHYPELTPLTQVTNSKAQIKKMAEELGRIILKPVDGFGGKGICFYQPGDEDVLIDEITHQGEHWIIAQAYLPAASGGDKRILLLDGEPLGAILRVHAEGVELNNMDAGGSANCAEIEDRDREICAKLQLGLIKQGIIFAGIDIIGGMLIEVNVTSPTGLQEMSRFDGKAYHHDIVSKVSL